MNYYNGYGHTGGFSGIPAFSETDYKKQVEKRAIKRASNSIGGAFLIMTGVALVLSFLLQLIIVLVYNDISLLRNSVLIWLEQDLLSVLGLTTPFVIAAKIMKFRVSDLMPLKYVRPSLTLPLVLICLGTFILGNYATSIIGSIFSGMGVTPAQPSFEIPGGVSGTILYLLSISFIPALVEEFALRGVVMGSLRRFGDGFAIFVSAALFGMMHGNLVQIPFAFVAGLALGYVDIIAGSLWPSIIAHLLNNLFATIISDYSSGLPVFVQDLMNLLYPLVMIVLGFIGIIWLLKQKPEGFRLPKSNTILSGKEKIKSFAATPCMILCFIYYAANMVLAQFIF